MLLYGGYTEKKECIINPYNNSLADPAGAMEY